MERLNRLFLDLFCACAGLIISSRLCFGNYFGPPFVGIVPAASSRQLFKLALVNHPRGGASSATIPNNIDVNPLIISSPVVAAAVCKDGIVLVATHHIKGLDNHIETTNNNNNHNEDQERGTHFAVNLRDLPDDFSGPFRIQSLDRQGTTLLTAGWRADAEYFANRAREIVKNERETLGPFVVDDPRVLASQFSLFMATAALDADSRELNCAGMLASPSGRNKGGLWLLDSTGAYALRAMALGGGSIQVNGAINGKLCQVAWDELSSEQGLSRLLKILSDCLQDNAPCAVEAAVVDLDGQCLVRKFLKQIVMKS